MSKIVGSYIANIFAQEVPSGTVDGVNTSFTLTANPVYSSTVHIYLNGLLQRQGTDYTVSGTAVSFTNAPAAGEEILATYIKDRP